MNLDQIREQIDSLDKELIMTLSKRMALIPNVAKYKQENNMPRFIPEREKAIIQEKRQIAKEQNINPDLAENIIKLIIEDAHRIEKKILKS